MKKDLIRKVKEILDICQIPVKVDGFNGCKIVDVCSYEFGNVFKVFIPGVGYKFFSETLDVINGDYHSKIKTHGSCFQFEGFVTLLHKCLTYTGMTKRALSSLAQLKKIYAVDCCTEFYSPIVGRCVIFGFLDEATTSKIKVRPLKYSPDGLDSDFLVIDSNMVFLPESVGLSAEEYIRTVVEDLPVGSLVLCSGDNQCGPAVRVYAGRGFCYAGGLTGNTNLTTWKYIYKINGHIDNVDKGVNYARP